ncbi:MAG: rhomboid family intramembrane serine protease [Thermodesulfobacteriota bacterium]|nr:rhomboid family intramembrane serine protease [Thermodesulfobacteriota bacterium]
MIRYFQQRPELLFVIKALLLVVLLKVLQDILYLWWFTILLCAPVFILLLLQVMSIHQNKGFLDILADNLTFIPAPYLERDDKYQIIPWVTYGLIGINVLVFYLLVPSLSDQVLDNLVFVPADITFFNTLISQLSNLFLHADGWHLWGNMAFLWAMGTVLERRIGSWWLLGLYLAVGYASNLFYLLAGLLVCGELSQSLGASGAISGLMGVFAVRCYFKTIVFPFPVLGLFSYIFPLNLKVRMNSLVVIGLFFWADMSSGIEQVLGTNTENIAYGAHIGGLLTGVLLTKGMKLTDAAIQEKRLDTARSAFGGKEWLDTDIGEEAVREYLQNDENDVEAILLLARKVSHYRLPDEGRNLYRRAILILLQSDLDEAVTIFKEYFDKYQQPLEPELQIRMAVLIEKSGNLDFATRCLEMLISNVELSPELLNKCLFHCSRLCKKMGLDEAAEMYSARQSEP